MLANTPVEGISPDFYVSHPLLQSGKMERREYQDNIFVNVLGKNALVVMPTGLGKTIIAVMLAVERLSAREGSKVVFLAPTKPLAAQHMKTFHDLTTIDPDFLILFTGAMLPDKRKKMWLDATVAFMTPQVLQNDLIAGRYTLADVSLLIFDEAHRAVGDYAYTFIAEKYLQQAACPQVIGITASPGGTQEKIQEVAQNLHVDHVEVKTDQSPDVRPYVHQIKVEFQKVDLPPDFQQVITYLSGELKVLYTYLNKLGILETAQVAKVTRKDLLAARTRVQGVLARPGDIDDLKPYFTAMKAVTSAVRLSHAQELVETQGIVVLDKYFAKCAEELASGQGGASMKAMMASPNVAATRALVAQLASAGEVHPKLPAVKAIVADQLARAPHSRVMVFSQFRDTVALLAAEFEDVPGARPLRFVGQASRGAGDKGLKQREQIGLLVEFRDGAYNVLVGTSVAEEGLDVSECDLVVFYDAVPSEIRTIQRRGRTGRRRDGRVIVLVAKGTRDEAYRWAAKAKEKQMKASLRALNRESGILTGKNRNEQQKILLEAGPAPAPRSGGQTKILEYAKEAKTEEGNPNSVIIATPECRPIVPESPAQIPVKSSMPEVATNPPEKSPPPVEVGTVSNPNAIQEEANVVNFTPVPGKVCIIVDHRETASPVVKHLSQLGATITFATLPVGDYVASADICVERKASPDFAASLVDGRLFQECGAIASHFSQPLLLLEGPIVGTSAVHPNAIRGAIATIFAKFRVSVMQAADALETATMLYAIAKKAQEGGAKAFKIRTRKAPAGLDSVQEFVLAGVPGLNNARTKALLAHFGNLEQVFAASEDTLQETEGIGPKLAKQVRSAATHPYSTTRRLGEKMHK